MMTVSEQLRTLGQRGILITAADEGIISELKCSMDECYCPKGSEYFDKRPEPVSDWAPSVDHVTRKSEGGQLTLDNIRLAHVLCNRVDSAIKQGKRHDKDLERARSGQFRDGHQATLQQSVYDRLPELVRDAEGLSHASLDDAEKVFHRGRATAFDEVLRLLSVDD